ncbi:MAG: hypothetical protein AAGB03_12215, partial [Pseudomonadota bacterium]
EKAIPLENLSEDFLEAMDLTPEAQSAAEDEAGDKSCNDKQGRIAAFVPSSDAGTPITGGTA